MIINFFKHNIPIIIITIIVCLFCSSGLYAQRYTIDDNKFIQLTDEGRQYYEKNLPHVINFVDSPHFPPIYQQDHWVCNQVAASYYMFTYETNIRKGLNSSDPANQYAVYFPWNIGNGGSGWYGDNYILSMEMMKDQGIPKMLDSPADQTQDSSLWASGYDFYYQLMHNKIEDYFMIDVSSAEGIQTLKGWVYDRLGTDYHGGSGTFLANSAVGGTSYLPAGTPEQGAYVFIQCGDNALHARTIIGYNDIIRYDYNGDGEYTNNIDLNGDGVIDARDWEIGGFRVAESYGPDWQGDGTCYFMYRTFAEKYGEGGILNNYVHVLVPHTDYKPEITAKIRLTHEARRRIKVKIGINPDTTATEPIFVKDFPFFNYQGGNNYMQGGTTEADKTIEFGLDITPLLEYFSDNSCAKIFLIVDEFDPHGEFFGMIDYFSIRDYTTANVQEFSFGEAVEMINHSTTQLAVNVQLEDLDRPRITTESLPMLSATEYNWRVLDFDEGEPPYKWELLPYFEQTEHYHLFEEFEGTKISPDNLFCGELSLEIPFQFPFKDYTSNSIKIHTRGYVLPKPYTSTWTQFREHLYPMFINEQMISPLTRFSMFNNHEDGEGIWYKFVQDTVKIRWKTSDQWSPWTEANFGVNLIADGTIEFLYGSVYLNKVYSNIGGISYGDRSSNIMTFMDKVPLPNTKVRIKTYPVPEGLYIDSNGVIRGYIGEYTDYPIRIKLTDSRGVSHTKSFTVTTDKDDISLIENKAVLYPNPVKDYVEIQIDNPENKEVILSVYSQEGRLVKKYVYDEGERFSLNLSHLENAYYLLKITMPEKLNIIKFIKE
jgi:hypothetical protein